MRASTASAKFSGWSAPTVARELSDLPRPFLSSPHHNLLGDKLAAMLEQRTQEPLISRSRAKLFLGQNDNIGSFIGCFCQVFRQPATFSFFRTRPRLL
jgi:hypothetical protein